MILTKMNMKHLPWYFLLLLFHLSKKDLIYQLYKHTKIKVKIKRCYCLKGSMGDDSSRKTAASKHSAASNADVPKSAL